MILPDLPNLAANAIVQSVNKTNSTPTAGNAQREREAERIRQIAAEARRRAAETNQKK